ncbi:uncharacterized protein [Aegilops tauschii subsp. strangulata]|uniref:uncharacterized protein isoform X2 n=1 Tax=Aegilops tauschii subsp. strangulata TaxID=200361 RepID=UPI001ABC7BB6|nr:uncharacterized protein LOC109777359 isoform X2 [Aegilops tauschii subsp. strangulata]
MAQAVALNGLNYESHMQFRMSVVPILIYRRQQKEEQEHEGEEEQEHEGEEEQEQEHEGEEEQEQEPEPEPEPEQANPNDPISVVPGIVTVAGETFCHIIANKRLLFTRRRGRYRFEIAFPNMNLDLDNLNVERHGLLAAFYCPVPAGTVDAVHFSNQTAQNQKLKMYGYQISASGQVQRDLTNGYLTHIGNRVGQEYIGHDCTPSKLSLSGSPIFNEERQLVGISYADFGITKALNVENIASMLSEFYDGMENRPMSDILQRIRDVGEHQFVQPADHMT